MFTFSFSPSRVLFGFTSHVQESSWWPSTPMRRFPSTEQTSSTPTAARTWGTWTLTSLPWQRRLTNRWPGWCLSVPAGACRCLRVRVHVCVFPEYFPRCSGPPLFCLPGLWVRTEPEIVWWWSRCRTLRRSLLICRQTLQESGVRYLGPSLGH